MSLRGAVDVLSNGERARYSKSLAIEAYFDGWNQAAGGGAQVFPRFLTRDEEEAWRDGWREAKAERATAGDGWSVHVPEKVTRRRPRRRECTTCPLLEKEAA